MRGRNREQGYSQRGSQSSERDYERGRSENQSVRRESAGGFRSGGYESDDDRDYSSGRYATDPYSRYPYTTDPSSRERGYSSDQVFGRGAGRSRESERWSEDRFGNTGREDRERERWAENRDRGYGVGVSGQYWTRDGHGGGENRGYGDNRGYETRSHDEQRFAGQYGQRDLNQDRFRSGWGSGNRGGGASSFDREYGSGSAELNALGVGGLQQGGFASYGERTSFHGRGPKGYARSDERIREDLSERLCEDHDVDATEISIVVKDGEVTLIGTVENRRQKHRAEDITDSVMGVKEVHNQLRVAKGVIGQIAEKVQQGVDRLTGNESRGETPRTGSPTANNRNAS